MVKTNARYCVLLIVACVADPPGPLKERAMLQALGASGCIDPVTLGAIPDDGVSDRPAIQAAIDAAVAQPDGGTVCLGAGRWTLDRAPVGSYNRFAALSTHGRNLTIRCDDAVLDLVGDQGGTSTVLLSFDPSAGNIRVTGCTLDSTAATNTHEQTHAIATSGICSGGTCRSIRNIEIDHNRLIWSKRTGEHKGDCIRLLGNTVETEVWGVSVHDNTGDCARSFVEIQRGVHSLIVDRNPITCTTCDQDIDGEATGIVGEVGRPTDIVISNNTFNDGPDVQGDFSIALTSVTGAVISGNTMGRGITLYRSTDVAIASNRIAASRMGSGRAVVEASNACDGLVVSGNTIRRGGRPGPVIGLSPHSGTTCSGAIVADNSITQGTAAWAISLESASRAVVAGNRITFTVPAPAYSAVYARSVLADAPITALSIGGNQIAGSVTYGVTLQSGPGTFGAGISVANNVATGTTFGLRCFGIPYGFAAPVISNGNALGPSAYNGVTVTAGD